MIKNGALLPAPFLTLTVDSSGERGLLGVAFDPNFASNNFVYVSSAVTALAEDCQLNVYPLTVEYVGPVPGLTWLTEVVVVLPGNLPTGQDALVSVTWHTRTSNKAWITIK